MNKFLQNLRILAGAAQIDGIENYLNYIPDGLFLETREIPYHFKDISPEYKNDGRQISVLAVTMRDPHQSTTVNGVVHAYPIVGTLYFTDQALSDVIAEYVRAYELRYGL
jgi:hypothetical protein